MRLVALAPAALLVLAGCGSSAGPVHSAHLPTDQTEVAPVVLECLPSSNGSTRQADLEAYIGDIVAGSNLEIDGVGVVDLGTNAPSVKGHFFVIAGLASPSRHYFNWVADQAFVSSGTGHTYPVDAPTRAVSLNTSSSPVSAPQVAIATADACADANYAKSSPLPPLPSATPTPAPTACAVLSCEMTVNSNVHGIPLPSRRCTQRIRLDVPPCRHSGVHELLRKLDDQRRMDVRAADQQHRPRVLRNSFMRGIRIRYGVVPEYDWFP